MPERPATSWWQAARWDDVRTLKSHGGDVNRRNGHGQTALHVAAGAGKEHAVKYLLANGADPRLAPPATGATPLHAAAAAGHSGAVRLLLRHDASAAAVDGGGRTQREREAKEVALRDARRAKQARATAEEHVKDLIEQVRQHERRGHRAHAALAEIIGRPD